MWSLFVAYIYEVPIAMDKKKIREHNIKIKKLSNIKNNLLPFIENKRRKERIIYFLTTLQFQIQRICKLYKVEITITSHLVYVCGNEIQSLNIKCDSIDKHESKNKIK